MSISLVTYGLNEKKNIPKFLYWAKTFLKKISHDYEIIFFDDGSTDNSYDLLRLMEKKYKYLKIIRNKKNFGPAYCIKKSLKLCRKKYLLIQTVDNSYILDSFIKKKNKLFSGEYDCLHGYRSKNILTRSDNLWKGVISLVNHYFLSILFGFHTLDYQNTYMVRFNLVKNIKLYANSSFINPELFFKLKNKGAKILELNVPFRKRFGGISKGTRFPKIIESVFEILKFRILSKKYYIS
jgi:glycosyltransferase involved in cell wall biosynthesis